MVKKIYSSDAETSLAPILHDFMLLLSSTNGMFVFIANVPFHKSYKLLLESKLTFAIHANVKTKTG